MPVQHGGKNTTCYGLTILRGRFSASLVWLKNPVSRRGAGKFSKVAELVDATKVDVKVKSVCKPVQALLGVCKANAQNCTNQ